ncbi:MAG TPA: sigma-70 family RNA polymerase sigma factor [Solirubrobacterales bacterium]|nr:sigma-70 family RNA polymerase sigma factor [Solirubrobacterales bacterium]
MWCFQFDDARAAGDVTGSGQESLPEQFERHRSRLRAVAYRVLGSVGEAEDAVQEAWIRLSRADAGEIESLGAWLTTVVGRIALDMLRSRTTHPEQSMPVHLPDPIVDAVEETTPENEAVVADSIGLAMQVVIERLGPAERLAYVLHDMFAVPFDEIAPLVERSSDATRQLASRARRRVRSEDPRPDLDLNRQREAAEAFLTASREGDFEALVAVLDPEVVLRADKGPVPASKEVRGAEAVAARAQTFARLDLERHEVLVNGALGYVATLKGAPYSLGTFTVRDGRIVELYFLTDPKRLAQLDLSAIGL